MSESLNVTIGLLASVVKREVASDLVQELDPGFFDATAEFIEGLKKQEFDNVENKIKNTLVDMATELIVVLATVRLGKNSNRHDLSNLLDEEKYILDSQEEYRERKDMILLAILNGKSKLLESIAQTHKTRLIPVRFLKDVEEFVGANLQQYGPFKTEDLATVPYDNAQALISTEFAAKIRLKD